MTFLSDIMQDQRGHMIVEAARKFLDVAGQHRGRDRDGMDHVGLVMAVYERITGIKLAPIMYCLLYTSPSPRDATLSRMPSSA